MRQALALMSARQTSGQWRRDTGKGCNMPWLEGIQSPTVPRVTPLLHHRGALEMEEALAGDKPASPKSSMLLKHKIFITKW